MTTYLFARLFVCALILVTLVKLWLARRHLAHIAAHRAAVPPAFLAQIDLPAHQKAADYTSSKTRLAIASAVLDAAILLVFTLGGGIQWLSAFWQPQLASPLLQGVAVIISFLLLSGLLDMPLDLYRTFIIEARYGFNKMTFALYLKDLLKSLLLGAVLGLPLLFGVLWMMERLGGNWWLYVWLVWIGFNLLLLFIYPLFIAPLFNKFQPLQDESLKTRIEALLKKCGFAASELFVMDGSRRSSHGNAYFTGFGRARRIVFFDTLIERLLPGEIEAVLAHELGHFRLHHVVKRIAASFAMSLAFLWLLARLMHADWFFAGLGVLKPSTALSTALALLLCFLVLPVAGFLLRPLMAALSRRHEFEADAYAAAKTDASNLCSALAKMYHDNAATLTPDPLYSAFYDSHPPALVRIARLQHLSGENP